MNNYNEETWPGELKQFLNDILKPIMKNTKQRQRMLTDEAMIIWKKAFTFETFSPSENYEELEYIGDAILKFIFPAYLMKRFPPPILNRMGYTELNIAYQSKVQQANLSNSMKLGKYARIKGLNATSFNIAADLYESFFGALYTCGDLIAPGIGIMLCQNMIIHLYNPINIDVSEAKGSDKTQVIQIFSRFELGKPLENVTKKWHGNSDQIEITISLDSKQLNFLSSHGVTINNPIGIGFGNTKKDAIAKSYKDARLNLGKYGITQSWAENVKRNADFEDPDIKRHVPGAIRRLNDEGYTSMYFFIPRKTTNHQGSIVELVAIDKKGEHKVLEDTFTTTRENSYKEAKLYLIYKYANKK